MSETRSAHHFFIKLTVRFTICFRETSCWPPASSSCPLHLLSSSSPLSERQTRDEELQLIISVQDQQFVYLWQDWKNNIITEMCFKNGFNFWMRIHICFGPPSSSPLLSSSPLWKTNGRKSELLSKWIIRSDQLSICMILTITMKKLMITFSIRIHTCFGPPSSFSSSTSSPLHRRLLKDR